MQLKPYLSFTLIEAIIVIAIIGIFATVAIIDRSSMNKKTVLLKAAKQLELEIRNMQGEAMGVALDAANDIPCSRGVGIPGGGLEYRVFWEKMSSDGAECATNYVFGGVNPGELQSFYAVFMDSNHRIITRTLKVDGINVDFVSLAFSIPDSGVYVDGVKGKTLEIELQYAPNPCPEFCRVITVNSFGQVYIN